MSGEGQPQQQERGIVGDTWNNMSHLQRFGAEVAVAGVGYMAYDQWRKHHGKEHTNQSQNEYQNYTAQYNQSQAASWLQPGGGQQQQPQQYAPQQPQGQLPPGWVIQYSQQYQCNFYHNNFTGESTWTFPQAINQPQGPPPSFQQQQPAYQPQHPQAPPPHHNGGIGETWNNMSHLQRFGAEAAVAGVGYLAYDQWRKHHGKEHSREAEVEYERYTRGI
ncbi:UNVERIFIED_CONTAM: hypothetical protein HDU68_001703 [Siphonaria sp. JEL0065]|nr:hypothetical protein HDU68_001703 [Siphonaria sp. JEL0065]